MDYTLTAADLDTLSLALVRRRHDHEDREPSDPDYDEGGPEPVMTSIGYVDLWLDGQVTNRGREIARESGDGQLEAL